MKSAMKGPHTYAKRNRAMAKMGASVFRAATKKQKIGIPNTPNSFKSMKRRMARA